MSVETSPESPLNDLPGSFEVANLLGALLGRKVTALEVQAESWTPQDSDLVALYRSDEGELLALCVCDLGLASALAASLSLLPASAATEARVEGRLGGALPENHHEVMNVCSRFFNSPFTPHVRLARVVTAGRGLSPESRQALSEPADRVDLEITVSGHVTGRMAMVHAGLVDEDTADARRPGRQDRLYGRVRLSADVSVTDRAGVVVLGTARDLSARGAYIACSEPFRQGTRCSLVVRTGAAEGGVTIRASARVVRIDDSGMALEITRLNEQNLTALMGVVAAGLAAQGDDG